MVKLIDVDGKKHIHTGNSAVPMSKVLDACTQGAFDECHDFYKVVRFYLDNGKPENDGSLMPLFRQMVAIQATAWATQKYGEPVWRHNHIQMPVEVSVMRVALMGQIESALATVKDVEPLDKRLAKFYQHMLNLDKDGGGGLSQQGKEIISDMFNFLIDDLVAGNLDFSATKH